MKSFFAVVGSIVSVAAIIIILPFISFWLAYFGGWLCSLVIGDILCKGFNTLFNTSYFTKDMIPICAATLGWIGGYFKARTVNINKD